MKKISCKREGTQIIKVILSLTQDLRRLSLPLVNSMRGRSRIKYGMTGLLNNSAFTLIELLVVVLIIGILAAVAVPQYKKAVKKSKATHVEVILDAASKAVDMYLLENGFPQSGSVRLTGKKSVSTIDLPGNCSKSTIDCYTDVGAVDVACFPSACAIEMWFSYNADGTGDPQNTWLSSKRTYVYLEKTAPGGKWSSDMDHINKNSTDAEEKQAAEVICPILEKYVAEDDAYFVANCK